MLGRAQNQPPFHVLSSSFLNIIYILRQPRSIILILCCSCKYKRTFVNRRYGAQLILCIRCESVWDCFSIIIAKMILSLANGPPLPFHAPFSLSPLCGLKCWRVNKLSAKDAQDNFMFNGPSPLAPGTLMRMYLN